MVYKFSDEKTSGSGIKNEIISNKRLAEVLHKPIIRKFKKRKVPSPSIDNNWDADLAYMQLKSKFNEWICFFIMHHWYFTHGLFHWKIKQGLTINNAFQKILKESNRKPNKIWTDKGIEFYIISMKSCLKKITEKCIQHMLNVEKIKWTFKNKIYIWF